MQHPVRVDKLKKHRKKDPPAYQREHKPEGGRVTRGEHDPHGSDQAGATEVVGHYPAEVGGGASSGRPRTWPPPYSDQGYPEPETALEVPKVIKKRRKGKRKPG